MNQPNVKELTEIFNLFKIPVIAYNISELLLILLVLKLN
jgi:hypothetical protein